MVQRRTRRTAEVPEQSTQSDAHVTTIHHRVAEAIETRAAQRRGDLEADPEPARDCFSVTVDDLPMTSRRSLEVLARLRALPECTELSLGMHASYSESPRIATVRRVLVSWPLDEALEREWDYEFIHDAPDLTTSLRTVTRERRAVFGLRTILVTCYVVGVVAWLYAAWSDFFERNAVSECATDDPYCRYDKGLLLKVLMQTASALFTLSVGAMMDRYFSYAHTNLRDDEWWTLRESAPRSAVPLSFTK